MILTQGEEKSQCSIINELDISDINEINKKNQLVNSPLLEQYLQFFKRNSLTNCREILENSDTLAQLQRYGVKYLKQGQFHPNLDLLLVEESINSEVILLEARWGRFITQLSILNVAKENGCLRAKGSKGSYGSVHLATLMNKQFAVKCLPLKKKTILDVSMSMALREVILMKITAALKIGPDVERFFGFDLIVFRDSVIFAMEKCEMIESIHRENAKGLRESLLLMHGIGLAHFDIKPDNIMFSPAFGKLVFIDFGLSELSDCQIGQRSLVNFRGTLNYCSPEMIECFETGQPKYVDIYYNDVHSLKITEKWIRQSFKQSTLNLCFPFLQQYTDVQIKQVKEFSQFIYLIKYLLFTNNLLMFYEIDKVYVFYINEILPIETLRFLYQLHPNSEIKKFYQKFLTTHHKDGIEFRELKEIYSSDLFYLKNMLPKKKKQRSFHDYRILTKGVAGFEESNLSHESVYEFLRSKPVGEVSKVVYYRHFLDFISFSNNVYGVSMAERVEVTQFLCCNELITCESEPNNDVEFIHNILLAILREMVRVNQTKHLEIQRDVIFDVVEHLFILNQLSLKDLISSLEQVFESKVWDVEHRFALILKVKHCSEWFKFRLKSYKTNVYYMYNQIRYWYHQKFAFLNSSSNNEYRWLNIVYQPLGFIQSKTIDLIQLSKLSRSLKYQLLLDILTNNIIFSSRIQMQRNLENLFNHINTRQKSKAFFFIFYFHNIFELQLNKPHAIEDIQALVKRNLNCEMIFNTLLMRYTQSFVANRKDHEFLPSLCEFLHNMNIWGLIMHQNILSLSFYKLQSYNIKYSYERDICFQIKNLLTSIIKYFNFEFFFIRSTQEQRVKHTCQITYDFANFINVKYCYYVYFNKQCNFQKERDDILAKTPTISCPHCRLMVENLCEYQYHRFMFREVSERRNLELEHSLAQNCFKLQKRYQQCDRKERIKYFQLMNFQTLLKICSLNQSCQLKYGGLKSHYFYLKEHSQLIQYIDGEYSIKDCRKVLNLLYQDAGLQQIVAFLKLVTIQLAKINPILYFSNLYIVFHNFIQDNYSKLNLNRLFDLLTHEYSSKKAENNYYTIFYVIMFINFSKEYIYKCIKKVITSINYLPKPINYRIQLQFYRLMIIQKDDASNRLIRFHLFYKRKIKAIRKRIVILCKILSQKECKFEKSLKFVCLKKQKLLQKAQKIGGPFRIENDQIFLFAFPSQINIQLNKFKKNRKDHILFKQKNDIS